MEVNIETEQFKDVYEIASEIGRGKFAVVKECRHKEKDRWYAAKVIRKRRKGVDCRAEVLQEVNMLHVTLTHPHFVDLIEVYESRHEMIIITELMRGGELFQHITLEGQLDERYTQTIMRQVLVGLSFLHSREIAHLDIKPQNILLTDQSLDCKVKLCDLGLARNVNRADVFEIIGTPDYLAPEILDYQKLSVACDMWSTGVLAYVMLSGYSPFAGDTNQETYLNISQVNLDFPEDYFSNVSPLAIEFIQKLLVKEPGSRLNAEESLKHAWLACPCPPSPVEHEPVKRLRFESDDLSECPPLNGLQKSPWDADEGICPPLAPIIPAISPMRVVKAAEVMANEDELESDTEKSPKGKKAKENFKSELKFTPTTPVNSFKSLSGTTPKTILPTTPTFNPSRSSIRVPLSSSHSPLLLNHSPVHASSLISNTIDQQISRFTDKPILDDLESSPVLLSPFPPGSPKLQTSELTPHLSRTKFWKDSSSEPSGISV